MAFVAGLVLSLRGIPYIWGMDGLRGRSSVKPLWHPSVVSGRFGRGRSAVGHPNVHPAGAQMACVVGLVLSLRGIPAGFVVVLADLSLARTSTRIVA